jgi:Coenzyme PQQ synthesis protein D (PqqD)
MSLYTKMSIPAQVMARSVGDETVILDLVSGTYYGLDVVGARIWQLIASGQTIPEICDTIFAEYVVERELLERDVRALIQSLADQKLVNLEA